MEGRALSVSDSRELFWRQQQAVNAQRRGEEPGPPLQFDGGGGTLPPMDLVDAKIAAEAARTDTKFAQLIGKLDRMDDKLTRLEGDSQRTRATVRTSAISLGLGLAALMVAIAGLLLNSVIGSFTAGARVDEIARTAAARVYQQQQQQAPPPASQAPPAKH